MLGRGTPDRGQVHTLEGVVAAVLILASVVFALQMTSVTPLSASTSSQHIENQQQATAEGVLASAADSGALKRAVLFWDETNNSFHDARDGRFYTRKAPPNELGHLLDRAFGARGIAYNVWASYQAGDGNATRRQEIVFVGAPSDNAVETTRTVVLTDDDRLVHETGKVNGSRLSQADFYTPDIASGSVYNVVSVEVVVWRI
jgi:hypothetical protein